MIKINSLFVRDEANPRIVSRDVDPTCQWVLDGEGRATTKWDGTACLVWHGLFYKRQTVKPGGRWPENWIHHSFDANVLEGPGWAPVDPDEPANRWHMEAFDDRYLAIESQTFELVGPKVQGNPHEFSTHRFIAHGADTIDLSRWGISFESLDAFLHDCPIEGIVWHHEDGRMAKIKRRDFGHSWPA